MEKIIDYVKRTMDEMKLRGGELSKLQMDRATFRMMLEEMDSSDDIIITENLGHFTYRICGLVFEEYKATEKDTVFIVT